MGIIDKKLICPCGSGKKYRKCCKKKKQRRVEIAIDMGKVVNGYVEISPEGQIIMRNENKDGDLLSPINANIMVNYERDNKTPKVLLDIPMDSNRLSFNIGHHLEGYNLVFAIDTNTKLLGKDKCSASAVVLCKITKQDGGIKADYIKLCAYTFMNREYPEKVGWVKLIEGIISDPQYSESSNIAIVVDSDYGNIPEYNSQRLPIIGDFYLPTNMNLIYASVDAGMENLPNKLLHLCDKEATELLEAAIKGTIEFGEAIWVPNNRS